MHGVIHAELKKFVQTTRGTEAWMAVLKEAGLEGRVYLPSSTYPDSETVAIVSAAARLTGAPADALLEDFGEFIAPDLLAMYRSLIKREWKTADLLLHTEETIHKVVRAKDPTAAPPRLRFVRTGPHQLMLYYDSPRKMAAVARGIIKGMAKHYGETVTITERTGADGKVEMTITIA